MTSERLGAFAPPVLWSSERAFVVDKPAGVLVHNSAYAGPREATLVDDVRRTVAAEACPVHRLDRQTSGALLFARDRATVGGWARALSADTTAKIYLALVRGRVDAGRWIDRPLRRPSDGPTAERRPALSRLEPVVRSVVDRCSLVALRLYTGRTHQARRHLKSADHPILGDVRYGKGDLNRRYRARYGLPRLALHAWRLVVDDGPERVDVDAPLPADLAPALAALFDVDELSDRLAQVSWPAALPAGFPPEDRGEHDDDGAEGPVR